MLSHNLAVLSASLNVLEHTVENLLADHLDDTLLGLDTIQQAKLQTLIPYILYDLIFIYLKANGVDPKSHPVLSELDRIRQYFDKIASAENSPQRRLALDKAAAGRFIKHALAQAQQQANTPSTSAIIPAPNQSSINVPIKVTSKMVARAQYEQELRDAADEEDEESQLQVWDSAPSSEEEDHDNPMPPVSVSEEPHATSKRQRPAINPFAGYDDNDDPADTSGSRGTHRKKRQTDSSGRSTPTAKSRCKV